MRIASAWLLALLATSPAARAAADAVDTAGDWLTEDFRGVIHVGQCDATYCGSVVGISDWQKDGSPPKDTEGRSQCQLVIIKDMKMEDDGRRHGTVTNPQDGRTYLAEMWVEEGVLQLRGYVAVPLLGSTQHWTPFHGTRKPDCHFSRG